MPRSRYPLRWKLSRIEEARTADHWIPATVPGAVQLDWAAAHQLPDFQVGPHLEAWQEMELSAWRYRALPDDLPLLLPGERLFLVLQGVDYACEVSLDGEPRLQHTGMQTPIALDVTDHWHGGVQLDVLIHPAPKAPDAPHGRSQARESCKPAVAYGWDFHPRLIPLGLWQETFLEVRAPFHFSQPPQIHYALSEDCSVAQGELQIILNAPAREEMTLEWRLSDAEGNRVFSSEERIEAGQSHRAVAFSLGEIKPWWPHDQGTPTLYRSEIFLKDSEGEICDQHLHRTGFRRVRLVMAPGEWDKPDTFPKPRSRAPITLEINGRRLFAKGSNWVCPDIFPGRLDRTRYEEQLQLVRRNHLNILRLWGGATAPQECFYELCDELGIMVWQDFPLSCNDYPDTAPYLTELDQESRSLILRLRRHPSLVLWCGGNELFNAWSGMTDQSHALRLLNRNTFELDPTTPFLPTAPIDGMGHGHYVFRDPDSGEEAWAAFQRSSCTAYSEFGCPAPPPLEILRRILPEAELWPPRPGTAWESHHAFGVWMSESWLHLPQIEHYFGPCLTLEELVERGQLLQAAGYQGLFEEARRQKPVASMALNWCFNEPWPCAANNSLVAWPCTPKPALAAVGTACRPTLASARIRKFSWTSGELFDPEIWILHDGPDALQPVDVSVWLEQDGHRRNLLSWSPGPITPNTNRQGPRAQCLLPEFDGPIFTLHLEVENRPDWSSTYQLIKARSTRPASSRVGEARTLNL